jgi:hypothetical protein
MVVPTSVGVNENDPAAGRLGRAIERAAVSLFLRIVWIDAELPGKHMQQGNLSS